MNTCLTCQNFTLQKSPIAKQGWGYCKFEQTPGIYYSSTYGRQCEKHQEADKEIVVKREEYLAQCRRDLRVELGLEDGE